MAIRLMAAVWDVKDLSSTQKLVALKLADNAHDDGRCFPSVGYIAEKCSLSERAVQKAITTLVARGIVSKLTRPGSSSLFLITLEPGSPTPEPGSPITITNHQKGNSDSHEHAKHNSVKKGIPSSWEPNAAHRADAVRRGLDAETLAIAFRDHHLAHGNQFQDWDAAFRTWIRRAEEFGQRRKVGANDGPRFGKQPASVVGAALRATDMLEREAR